MDEDPPGEAEVMPVMMAIVREERSRTVHATRLSISECGGVGEVVVLLAKSPWGDLVDDRGAFGHRACTRLCTLRKAAELWLLVVRVDR